MPKYTRRGRPVNSQCAPREALLAAAKSCFTKLPYEKVTTRKLAQEAGVNVGMIRYYFTSKQGLYECMFSDMIDNVIAGIKEQLDISSMDGFAPLFELQTRFIAQYPEFPLLVQKELWGKGYCQQHLLDLLSLKLHPLLDEVIVSLRDRGLLKPSLNVLLLRTNVISLMVFPFLSRPAVERMENVSFDEAFLLRLAAHSAEILEQGSMLTPHQS